MTRDLRLRGHRASLLVALLGAALPACGGGTSGGPPATDHPPVIDAFSVPGTTTTVGDVLALSVTAHDADGDALSYSWTETCTGGGSGTFSAASAASTSWTAATAGACTLTVVVTARGATVTRSADVTISSGPVLDHAPVIDSFSMPASTMVEGGTLAVSVTAHDPEGDTLSYQWSATCTGGGAGSFTAPTAASTSFTATAAGACTLHVVVTGGTLSATQSGSVTITSADHPPVVDSLSGTGGSVFAGTVLTLAATAHDPDGDALSYAWTQQCTNGSGQFSAPAAASTSWTAGPRGSCTITVTVTARSLTGTRSASVTVGDTAPVVDTLSGATSSVVLAQVLNLSATAHDADGDSLAYLWTQSCSAGSSGSFGTPAAATTTWTAGAHGSCTLTVTVTGNGLTGTKNASVTIADQPPVVDTLTGATTPIYLSSVLSLAATAHDPDGDSISYGWTKACVGGNGSFGTPGAATTTWTATARGTCVFTVTATANGLTAHRDSATVTIADRPPVIDTLTGATSPVTAGSSLSLAATAHDPDGDTVSYAWTQSCSGGGSGSFTTPAAASTTWNANTAGACTLTLTVTANGLTATQASSITINAPATDLPPVIDSVTGLAATATVNTPLQLAVTAHDPNGDTLSYAWTQSCSSGGAGSFGTPTAATTSWTPTAAGSCTLTITVTALAKTATSSGAVTISAAGAGPTFVPFAAAPTSGGTAPVLPWSNGEPKVVKDRTPGSLGELLGFGWAGKLVAFKSGDLGASWTIVNDTVTETVGNEQLICIGQDSTGQVHLIFGGIGPGATYSRVTVAHDGTGAITGFSSAVKNVSLSGGYNSSANLRGSIAAVLDQSGAETIVYQLNDIPSAEHLRVQMAVAKSLTPASGSDFTALDGTAGTTVLVNVDTSLTGPVGGGNHTHSSWFAQLGSTRDLWAYWAPINTGDSNYTDTPTRVRISPSGPHTWSVGTPVALATASGSEYQGYAIYGTQNYVWFMYFHPTDGISIDRVAADGTYTHPAATSPDSSTSRWGWGSFSVADDEKRIWAIWHTLSATAYPGSPKTYEAFWNGASWTKSADPTSTTDCNGLGTSVGWGEGVVSVLVTDVSSGAYTGPVSIAIARGGSAAP